MKDIVCGMDVDEKSAAFVSVRDNETYAFCSKECKEKFDRNPAHYEREAATRR